MSGIYIRNMRKSICKLLLNLNKLCAMIVENEKESHIYKRYGRKSNFK